MRDEEDMAEYSSIESQICLSEGSDNVFESGNERWAGGGGAGQVGETELTKSREVPAGGRDGSE